MILLENLDSYVDYTYDFIETICEDFGPRYSGSEAEDKANKWIKEKWSKFCDETNIEEFKVHPHFYPQGVLRMVFALGVFSFLMLPLKYPFSIFASVIILLGMLVYFFEFMLLKGILKFLYKKKTSSNVFGIIKPREETKCRVILDGHTDSAKELHIGKINNRFYEVILYSNLLVYGFFVLIYSIVKVSLQSSSVDHLVSYNWFIFELTKFDLYIIPIIFVLLILYIIFFLGVIYGKTVMGANDNLSGTAVAAAVGKYFSKNRLKNVELIIVSTGSEEIGERGAYHFVRNNPELFQDSLSLVYECIGAGKVIVIVEEDYMHLARYSQEVVSRFVKAYEIYRKQNEDAIPCTRGKLLMGSSNANIYVKAGYESAFIIGVRDESWKPVNWHTLQDTIECIDKKFLNDVIGISLCFVKLIDEEYS
ncbi:MAG: M28 family peptidase [Candidatus Heimdallarchaeota archaeon]